MRKLLSLLLTVCLLLPLCSFADEAVVVYESDFTYNYDKWFGRGEDVKWRNTKNGTLEITGRKEEWDSLARSFDLVAGVEYHVSVEVRQKKTSTAEFVITMERKKDGETGWDNLVFGTAKNGAWTELSGNFIPGEYDSYLLYVETKGTPNLSFEIRNFRLEAPNGFPKAKETGLFLDKIIADAEHHEYSYDGMHMPLIEGQGWECEEHFKVGFGKRSTYVIENEKLIISNESSVNSLKTFYETPEEVSQCYNSVMFNGNKIEKETIDIDGYPAIIAVYDKDNAKGFFAHCGSIVYVRQNRLLRIDLSSQSTKKSNIHPEEVPTVTMDLLCSIAAHVSYDISEAPITAEDLSVTVTAKDAPQILAAGKNIELDAMFTHPDKAFEEANNNIRTSDFDEYTWYAIDTETGAKIEEVKFKKAKTAIERRSREDIGKVKHLSPTNHQNMKVAAKLDRVIYAEIIAESAFFHTKGSYPIILTPAVKKMKLHPDKLTLFTGSKQSTEVNLTLEPECIPLVGIIWNAAKEGIIELIPGQNGSAVFKPLKSGKTTVTVSEPGGKKTTLPVTVVEPVEQIELSTKGGATPGKAVTVNAKLFPQTAGVKDLEWTIDADGSIATISPKGQVKIAKDAPAGTVITVTCKALGAPEPVTAELKLTVE